MNDVSARYYKALYEVSKKVNSTLQADDVTFQVIDPGGFQRN